MDHNSSRKNERSLRFKVIVIMLGMLVVIAITLAVGVFLINFSGELAARESYQDIAFMRYPVLIICESVIVLFLVPCALSFPLLARIYRGKSFTLSSVRLLRVMSICFFLMILPFLALEIYTEQFIGGSIINLYCFLGMGIAFIVANLFGLFTTLIERASEFEQEINLTI